MKPFTTTALAAALLAASAPAAARVTRFEVTSRRDIALGRSFGRAGAYEKVAGRVHFAVRPDDPRERRIADLALAPRNARGEVEFSADFHVLRPKDAARGRGTLLLEVPNRGRKAILAIADRAVGSDDPVDTFEVGDGYLLREGYTIAWVGWQIDVRPGPGLMRLDAPVARGPSGPLRGPVRSDFAVPQKEPDHPLGHLLVEQIGGEGYPVADAASATITVRDAPLAPREPIPRERWRFPDPRRIALDGGFAPGRIYEVVYTAEDPPVAGLGLAAVRDFAIALKRDPRAPAPVKRALAVGISQTGRFLRQLLYDDLNADEQGRPALDGVIAHVAGAGRGSFNHRFAQPSRDAQPLSPLFYPVDLFPFADVPAKDPETGEVAGLLDRARASRTAPKLFLTNTSYEYWGRAAALVHVTPDGARDLEPGPEVRVYLLAGLQHFTLPWPPKRYDGALELKGRYPYDPNPVAWFWRALLRDMAEWVERGAAPPPSAVPRLADGTLVALDAWRFPAIPGAPPPEEPQRAWRLDFGPDFASKGIIAREPPAVGAPFPALVPQVDADGNDRGGVAPPELSVPLATYTGWNLRDPSIGAPGARVSFLGSCFLLPRTEEERRRTGDPRRSIAERYPSRDAYLARYADAARRLVGARFLLEEDVAAVVERGAQEWDFATGEAR
jgi:Alpha/beta hydrolase domain